MIALTFALPSESLSLREHFRHTGETAYPHAVLGSLGLHECLLVHTGIGAAHTRERLAPVLNDPVLRPTLLISSGYAGALSPELPAGVLFLAKNFSAPESLQIAHDLLTDRQIPVRAGRLYSSSQMLETPEEKQALGKRTKCDAIDMETEAIAALCAEHGLPMLSLRAISDNAVDPVPVPFEVCIDLATGRPRIASILWHLLGHPWRIPGFLQFAKKATQSRELLGQGIATLLPQLQPL